MRTRAWLAWPLLAAWLSASPALAKPKAGQVAAAPSALTELQGLVDHTGLQVDAFVREVRGAGNDAQKLVEIGRRFQSQMQGTEVRMEALQRGMDAAQRAQAERYGRDKLAPRMAAMQAALELVAAAVEELEDAAEPEAGPAAETFRGAIAKLAAEADALVAVARAAGQDAGRREAVRQQLAQLGGRRNAAYESARKPEAVDHPERLFRAARRQLEPKLQRIERLLRLGLQPPCTLYDDARHAVSEMAADARRLVDGLGDVADAAALEAVKKEYAQALAAMDRLPWDQLTPDERQELAAQVAESVSPAIDAFVHRTDALQQKLAP